jgi:acetyl-CoA carboxylase alpha subunit
VPEPIGGAHADPTAAAALVDAALQKALEEVGALDSATRLTRRYEKFRNMGRLGVEFVDEGS